MDEKSRLQGNPEACQYTARAYQDGIGTRVNISKAEDWYLKAYALGKVDSLTSLAEAFIKEEKFIDAIAAYKLAFQNSESIENKLDLKRLMDQHPEITIKSINSKIENLKKKDSRNQKVKTRKRFLLKRIENMFVSSYPTLRTIWVNSQMENPMAKVRYKSPTEKFILVNS